MPDTDYHAPISLHGYRCAGKPAIHDAHAEHGPDESARPLCGMPVVPDESERPLCGVPVVPDESDSPSCGVPVGVRRVPCGPSPGQCPSCRASPVRNESRSMPVVPSESRADTSPGRCPSCRASPVRERVPVDARHLPCPGPTAPVADAANRCVANIFSLVRRGAS